MVPTLYGAASRLQCSQCQRFQCVHFGSDQPDPGDILPRHRRCVVCGGQLDAIDTTTGPATAKTQRQADTVTIRAIASGGQGNLRRGDLVALMRGGRLRVKRLAALPGDEIAISGERILVNGKRAEDFFATDHRPELFFRGLIVVDEDEHQSDSRWGLAEQNSSDEVASWHRTSSRVWVVRNLQASKNNWTPWLLYRHRNIYGGNKPGAVMDDYPLNVGVSRRLNEADRLAVSTTVMGAETCRIEVAFWTSAGVFVANVPIRNSGTKRISFYDARPVDSSRSLPTSLGKESPIAIRIRGDLGPWKIERLSVQRFVEYRVRSTDRVTESSVKLLPQQVYVLGDNVPVSQDSRQWGPVAISDIVGRVVRIEAGE